MKKSLSIFALIFSISVFSQIQNFNVPVRFKSVETASVDSIDYVYSPGPDGIMVKAHKDSIGLKSSLYIERFNFDVLNVNQEFELAFQPTQIERVTISNSDIFEDEAEFELSETTLTILTELKEGDVVRIWYWNGQANTTSFSKLESDQRYYLRTEGEDLEQIVEAIADGTGGKAYPDLTTAMAVIPLPDDGVIFTIDESNESEKGIYAYDSGEVSGYRFVRKIIKIADEYDELNGSDVTTAAVIEPRLLEFGNPIFENSLTPVTTGVTYGEPSMLSESSTPSGWGSSVGVLPPFNRIRLKVRGWKPDELPTQIRVRIKIDDYQGEVLFDEKVAFETDENDFIEFDFPVINSSESLYVEYLTDGRVGMYGGTTSGSNNGRYATSKNPDGETNSSAPDNRQLWVEYSFITLQFKLTDEGIVYFDENLPAKTNIPPLFETRKGLIHQTTDAEIPNLELSTFSAWGCGVGVIDGSFTGIELKVRGWKPDELPTQIRVRVRENDYNGTIIADKIIPYVLNQVNYYVDFGEEISSENELWVEYLTDGRVGFFGTNVDYDIGQTPVVRYATSKSLSAVVGNEVSSLLKRMINYRFVTKIDGEIQLTDEGVNEIKEAIGQTAQIPEILMNNKAYVFPGFEYNIFNKNLAVGKYGNPENYTFDYSASNGKQIQRGYRYVGVPGQSFNVTAKVYSDSENFVEKTQNIVVPSASNGTGIDRKVLIIGDSTVDGGDITNPLYDVFDSDVMDVTFVGTRGESGKKHEGRGGWKIEDYYGGGRTLYVFNVTGVSTAPGIGSTYTNNSVTYTVEEINISGGSGYISCTGSGAPLSSGTLTKTGGTGDATLTFSSTSTIPGNPFYNPSTEMFDLDFYLTETSQTLGDDDWIFFQLGINDVFNTTSQSGADIKVTTMLSQMDAILANIHDYNSNIRVGIVVTIPPANQDAFGSNYNAGQTSELYRKIGLLTWQKKCIEHYDDREAERIYLIPTHLNIDIDYNFLTSEQQVNSRNSETITVQSNGVHPASSGYLQMADVYAGIIKNFE